MRDGGINRAEPWAIFDGIISKKSRLKNLIKNIGNIRNGNSPKARNAPNSIIRFKSRERRRRFTKPIPSPIEHATRMSNSWNYTDSLKRNVLDNNTPNRIFFIQITITLEVCTILQGHCKKSRTKGATCTGCKSKRGECKTEPVD